MPPVQTPDAAVRNERLFTVTLTARGGGTHLTWVQEFESPEAAAKLRSLIDPANEQNLDRLQALLADSGD